MTSNVDILIVDDDKVVQKIVKRSLESEGIKVRSALNGEDGLAEAYKATPDIILLDVEMPGLSGYEVCHQLRENPRTSDVPVVFISSHSSLRERMQGYEAGADDYLVKPFDPEHLMAKIRVLIKYLEQKASLEKQYKLAEKAALIAMAGTSELGVAMDFMTKIFSYNNYETLAQGFFLATGKFGLNCCLLILDEGESHWFATDGNISPLEKEMIEMAEKETRIIDFGSRTIVNYPGISLLVRNMPIDDMERYGRTKDILPVFLQGMEAKIHAVQTELALMQQSEDLLRSFGRIRTDLYYLAKTLMTNQEDSAKVMHQMIRDLNLDLLRMALDDDQEKYLLNRIESAIEEAAKRIDASPFIANSLSNVFLNLKTVTRKQQILVETFIARHTSGPAEEVVMEDDNIELF
ncbi:response regulator [Methylomonas rosea]|uniref:Response regulator n=1 Tax=Methylomonas rosea TaxID=2952227 RepID=A0ABT1TY49_9GAMM|nr:response regulator [Methylomonas sp. WSC-7]MCQ8119690.1 response regulator [Methylomonas sp. WSC-7]